MKILRLAAGAISVFAPVVAAVSSVAQTIQVSKDNRTIAITATDSVLVMADTATVHVGFIAYGADKDTAYAAGSGISNAIIKALTSGGVPSEGIESENQNIAPVQEYQVDKLTQAEKAQRKFQVTQSWSARVNAADATRVLDLAVKAGANQSGQIDWSLKDENAPQAQAAAKALQRARVVAGEMAAGLNVKLGSLVFASNETQAEPPCPRDESYERSDGGTGASSARNQSATDRKNCDRLCCLCHRIVSIPEGNAMPVHEYRELKPSPEAEAIYRRWLARLNEEFTRHQGADTRSQIVRDELVQLYLGRPYGGPAKATLNTELAMHSLIESFDPRNATLEPEYYGDVDAEKYAVRKPLIWFWQMFDRSPIGLNHWLGFRFRCMLGRHIFRHLGKHVKIFHNVEFTYGYNLTIEDWCTIPLANVMLDDRGEIILHEGTSVSDYANVYLAYP